MTTDVDFSFYASQLNAASCFAMCVNLNQWKKGSNQ